MLNNKHEKHENRKATQSFGLQFASTPVSIILPASRSCQLDFRTIARSPKATPSTTQDHQNHSPEPPQPHKPTSHAGSLGGGGEGGIPYSRTHGVTKLNVPHKLGGLVPHQAKELRVELKLERLHLS